MKVTRDQFSAYTKFVKVTLSADKINITWMEVTSRYRLLKHVNVTLLNTLPLIKAFWLLVWLNHYSQTVALWHNFFLPEMLMFIFSQLYTSRKQSLIFTLQKVLQKILQNLWRTSVTEPFLWRFSTFSVINLEIGRKLILKGTSNRLLQTSFATIFEQQSFLENKP